MQGRGSSPVGRLDAESRGLLLLTNDGELTNQPDAPAVRREPRPTGPSVEGRRGSRRPWRTCRAASGWPTPRPAGGSRPAAHETADRPPLAGGRAILEITLREGRNRQVRRMLAKVGHKVRDLIRVQMGPLTLDGLKPGQCRQLTDREVRALRKLTRPAEAEVEQPVIAEVADEDGEN